MPEIMRAYRFLYYRPTKGRPHQDNHSYNTLRLKEYCQTEIQESRKRTVGVFVSFVLLFFL